MYRLGQYQYCGTIDLEVPVMLNRAFYFKYNTESNELHKECRQAQTESDSTEENKDTVIQGQVHLEPKKQSEIMQAA